MKTLKISNIILIVLGLSFVTIIILKVFNATIEPAFNAKNAKYSERAIKNYKPFKHLVLNAYTLKTYEIKYGNEFKLEIFSHPRFTDKCNNWFIKDTLFVNIFNNELYTECSNTPEIKITLPYSLNSITARNIICNIDNIQQDTLNLYGTEGYTSINVDNSKVNTLIFNGKSSSLVLSNKNEINELLYFNKGEYASLHINDLLIKKLKINSDSNSITLSGKAIDYYLNK